MKRRNVGFTVLAAVFAACLSSCMSTAERRIDSAYVMVYDYYDGGLMGVSVFIDEVLAGETDIYGRLMIPVKDGKDKRMVRVEKEGHETVRTETLLRPKQLLYFKMGSGVYYAECAEKFLDENKIDKARKMIDKALEIENRKDWLFLKEVILGKEKGDE